MARRSAAILDLAVTADSLVWGQWSMVQVPKCVPARVTRSVSTMRNFQTSHSYSTIVNVPAKCVTGRTSHFTQAVT